MSENLTVKCGECGDVMRVIRVSRQTCRITDKSRVKCFCQTCGKMRNEYVLLVSNEPSPPAEVQPAPKTKKLEPVVHKKRVKRPTTRTIAGLKGRSTGAGRLKTWHFTYPTKYMPLLLRMKKYMGYWEVHFGEMRMGSGQTMVEALEQAKRRMRNCGYELVKGAKNENRA